MLKLKSIDILWPKDYIIIRKEIIFMPIIARFYGMVVKMYYFSNEHNPPHIHVIYGDYVGVLKILDGEMIQGDLPIRA